MKKSSFSYFPIVVAGACLAVLVMTTEAIKIDHPKFNKAATDIVPGRYIVSFNGNNKASADAFSAQSVEGADLSVQHRYSHDLFSGVSIKVDASSEEVHASALKSILDRSDVRSVTPVRLIKRPKVFLDKSAKKGKKGKKPSILPHAMTQVDLVHSELKNKGKGIHVGVLDTGKLT
jgi:hypothetical protein